MKYKYYLLEKQPKQVLFTFGSRKTMAWGNAYIVYDHVNKMWSAFGVEFTVRKPSDGHNKVYRLVDMPGWERPLFAVYEDLPEYARVKIEHYVVKMCMDLSIKMKKPALRYWYFMRTAWPIGVNHLEITNFWDENEKTSF